MLHSFRVKISSFSSSALLYIITKVIQTHTCPATPCSVSHRLRPLPLDTGQINAVLRLPMWLYIIAAP